MTQGVRWYARRGDIKRLFDEDQHVQSQWTFESPLWLGEMDEALDPRDDYGQLWVKTPADEDSPNTLWYTDDLGNDYQLTDGSGFGGDHFQSIYLAELAAARGNDADYGQVWVNNAISSGMTAIFDDAEEYVTSSLWYTDDAGHDVALVADAHPILLSGWTFGNFVSLLSAVRIGFNALDPTSGRLELEPRNADPDVPAGSGYLYTKGSPSQLYFRSSNGTVTQLTP